MDIRPLRSYEFRFVHEGQEPIEFQASGCTPCQARGFAFMALEGVIARSNNQSNGTSPVNVLPIRGWKLEYQRPV